MLQNASPWEGIKQTVVHSELNFFCYSDTEKGVRIAAWRWRETVCQCYMYNSTHIMYKLVYNITNKVMYVQYTKHTEKHTMFTHLWENLRHDCDAQKLSVGTLEVDNASSSLLLARAVLSPDITTFLVSTFLQQGRQEGNSMTATNCKTSIHTLL